MAMNQVIFDAKEIVRIVRRSHSPHIPADARITLHPSPQVGEDDRVAFEWTTPNRAPESKLAQVREQESNE